MLETRWKQIWNKISHSLWQTTSLYVHDVTDVYVQLRRQGSRVTSRCIHLRRELLPTPHSAACNRNMLCSRRVDFSKIFLSAKKEDLWYSHPRLLKHPRSTGAIKVMGECCATYVLLLVRSQRLSFQFLSRRRRSRSITFCKNAWIAVDWVQPKCECRVQVIKVAGLVWSGPATTEQLMLALHFKLQSGLCWAAVGRTHSKNLVMAEWVRSFLSQSSRENMIFSSFEGLRGSSVGQERSVTPQADEMLKQACYSLAVENWSFNIFHACTHMD